MTIHTPLGTVREIGTQFEVRIDEAGLAVTLREGLVVVSRDEREFELRAGTELALDAEGAARTRSVPVHGDRWDWIVALTPAFELEGRSAREFLDWVVRERGFTLKFADPSVERSADEIVLDGSLARLSLDQALDAVLPTCRMSYRAEDGVLLVAGAP